MSLTSTNTPGNSSENDISFHEFILEATQKVADMANSTLDSSFQSEHRDSLGIGDDESIGEGKEEIENNFLYNIPNIIAYIHKELGDEVRPLIFELARLYKKHTGDHFLGIDWDTRKRFPLGKLDEYVEERDLSEDYNLYLFGRSYFVRYVHNKRKHKYKNSPGELLKKSSLYRKKVLKNLDNISQTNEAEYIRMLVSHMLDSMYDIQSVSDEEFVGYLRKKAEENLKEQEFEEGLSSQERIERQEKKRKNKREVRPEEFLSHLDNIPEELSNGTKEIFDPLYAESCKKELESLAMVCDVESQSHKEKEIIHHVLGSTIRYHKNHTEDNSHSGIPKNFRETGEYTCFSGTWLTASLLLKNGLDPERLFFMDSTEGAGANVYKHAYLLYKTANGQYTKVDYAFGDIYKTKSFDIEVEGLEYGMERSYYHMGDHPDNDYSGYMYRLDDGISLMYIVSLMGSMFHEGEYDKVIELGNIAKSFDKKAYHIYELQGLAYEKLGEHDLAIEAFKECKKCNSISTTALFKMGEHYYLSGENKKAQETLKKFQRVVKRAWKIDPMYKQRAEEYIKNMKEEKSSTQEKVENFLDMFFPNKKENMMQKEYLSFKEDVRHVIIKQAYEKVSQESNVESILFLLLLIAAEKESDSPLYKKVTSEMEDIFTQYLTN